MVPGAPVSRARPRILHMVQNLNYGGMERVIADLLRGLDPRRFELHLLVLQYLGRFAEGLDAVAELHQAPALSRWSMLFPLRLAELVRRLAPDVVHTHSGVWYKGAVAARHADVSGVIHTEHGRKSPDPRIDRVVDRRASRYTDIVAAVSQPLGEHLRARVVSGGCRVDVIPNGIDVELFRPRPGPSAIRQALGISPETPIIGSIGRLEPIKGYDIMIQAFAKLQEKWRDGPKPILLLAGDGSERSRLRQLAGDLGVADQARFLGWRDDPGDLLEAFTIFTMSSHSEGTSVSLLEAMSSGVCPVVTDVGGNRAVLGPDLVHRLLAPGAPEQLAESWRDALRDAPRRISDGAKARARVVERHGVATMVAAYERRYAEVLPSPLSGA